MHQSDTQTRLAECVGFGSYVFDMLRSGLSDAEQRQRGTDRLK